MKAVEILSKISTLKIENLMKHEEWSDIMDFLGCKGLKRECEYHYLDESISLRKLHRWAINHLNEIIYDKDVTIPHIVPSSWEGHSRIEVDVNTRKRYIKQMFIDWRDWERDTLDKLSSYYKEMEDIHCLSAYYILEMMEDVSMELKYLERQMLEYDATDWNMVYIMSKQEELHDCYKRKIKDLEL
jgi:hypothetical protein